MQQTDNLQSEDPNHHISYLKDIYTHLMYAHRSLQDLKTYYVRGQVYDKAQEIFDLEKEIGRLKDQVDEMIRPLPF
jgi:hypothetical protein